MAVGSVGTVIMSFSLKQHICLSIILYLKSSSDKMTHIFQYNFILGKC